MKKHLFALCFFSFALPSCVTPIEWEKGGLRPSEGASPSIRMTEYVKFAPHHINSDGVWIRERSELLLYNSESFKTAFDSVDPKIYPTIIDANHNSKAALIFAIAGAVITSHLLTVNRDLTIYERLKRNDQIFEFVALGFSFGGQLYFGRKRDEQYKEATNQFRDGLDKKLFPK